MEQLDSTLATLPTEERRSIAPELLLGADLAWEKYKLPLMAGVAFIVVAVVGWGFHESHAAKVAVAASVALDYAKTAPDFQKVIDTYPGTEAAANAYLLLGRAKYDGGDFTGAAGTWEQFAVKFPHHVLVPNALAGEAGALEAAGKPEAARALYQRVATSYQSSYAAPLARISEATLLLSEGKSDEAKHVYEDVIASAPKSDVSQIAAQGLRMLNTLPVMKNADPAHATPSPAAAATPPPVAAPVAAIPESSPAVAPPSAAASPAPSASAAAAPSGTP